MIRIMIADDHAILREGLKNLICREPDFEIVAEASTGSELMSLMGKTPCDVVVLDITMPDMNGLDVLKWVKNHHSAVRVLILSMHSEDQYAFRALKAGAEGYLTKGSEPSLLFDALRRIHSGGKYISPHLGERLASALRKEGPRFPHELLSDREFLVFREIASGRTVSEIASKLNLSIKTISTYRTRVLSKMSLHTNSQLTRYAMENGLIH